MKKEDLPKLPTSPGVYFFLQKNKILYIGKAASLKDRVHSYFSGLEKSGRGLKIIKMVALADKVKYQVTDSVLEAFLLENSLIKKHQPDYNTKDKDDKSFFYLIISKEDYPRVLMVRSRDIGLKYSSQEIDKSYGPFPFGNELKTALNILRPIFPWRDKCQPESGKLCFNYQIGLCSGSCGSAITKQEYRKIIKDLKVFLRGGKKKVINDLKKEMKDLAQQEKFEKASLVRDRLKSLNYINDIALLKNNQESNQLRLEAFDIAHLAGRQAVGSLAVVENGQINKEAGRYFILKSPGALNGNDPAGLREIISRRLKHKEWPYPDIIVMDGGMIQYNIAKEILQKFDLDKQIAVVAVTKDKKRRVSKIITAEEKYNYLKKYFILSTAEAHKLATGFHRKKINKMLK